MMMHRVKSLYEFGTFCLDPAERLLLRDNKPVPLTSKVFDILTILVENSGHLLEKDVLMQAIWPDTAVEEGNLPRCVSTLRKALGESRGEHKYIETVPRRGYRFVCSVTLSRSTYLVPSARDGALPGALIQPKDKLHSRRRTDDYAESVTARSENESVGPNVNSLVLEPPGGAVSLNSEFYIVRPTNEEFRLAIALRDNSVSVKGARQVGKTPLLARDLKQARHEESRVVLDDLQMLDATHFESAESLLLALAAFIAEQLDVDVLPEKSGIRIAKRA
jgi:DNA-binding winged helix-turn-helix (wHTH) protein